MSWNRVKKILAGTALILTFLLSSVAGLQSTAQAQDWRRDRNWRRDRDDRDRDRIGSRREQILRDLEMRRARERARYRAQRSYPYGYGGYGNYGRYGGGYSNGEVQKGYRDGLDRGQEDARDRRSFNPNNSSHYRSGNAAYREGFRQGYDQGYRQYARYRGW